MFQFVHPYIPEIKYPTKDVQIPAPQQDKELTLFGEVDDIGALF